MAVLPYLYYGVLPETDLAKKTELVVISMICFLPSLSIMFISYFGLSSMMLMCTFWLITINVLLLVFCDLFKNNLLKHKVTVEHKLQTGNLLRMINPKMFILCFLYLWVPALAYDLHALFNIRENIHREILKIFFFPSFVLMHFAEWFNVGGVEIIPWYVSIYIVLFVLIFFLFSIISSTVKSSRQGIKPPRPS